MSLLKKLSVAIIIILALIYTFVMKPDGNFLVPVAELIKRKAAYGEEDSRIHSLDLEKYRKDQPRD